MTDVIHVPAAFAAASHCDSAKYHEMYERSVSNPEAFWAEQAERLDWMHFPTKIKDVSFTGDVHIRWYEDGELNVCYNCVDRHLDKRGDQTAIIFEGDDPNVSRHITYRELHQQVSKLANVMKSHGVAKGDRVTIYLPMIPEAAYAMLACARIGAIHSVVFGGFSPDSLADRINDCNSTFLITSDGGLRGGKTVPLKTNADKALQKCSGGVKVLMFRHTGIEVPMTPERDIDGTAEMAKASPDCPPERIYAEDPLFILYTSGSTGKPKGVLHTSGGYLVFTSMTHQYVFDYKDGDIYWCTADVGWVTGHSYIVYGPLANGATTLMFEGVPNYPDFSRLWQIVDKHQVNIFYTAPTAIRALMQKGDDPVKSTSRQSLRLLGTVGEPINPEAWRWYHQVVGEGRCPVVDTWWQTETGGILVSTLPAITEMKPGSAGPPLPGISVTVVDRHGEVDTCEGGYLVVDRPWPGMPTELCEGTRWAARARERAPWPVAEEWAYPTEDGAFVDEDGYVTILGRVDDVINVSGHRFGTMEIESAIVEVEGVAEAAVVSGEHGVHGKAIYAYVSPEDGHDGDEQLRETIVEAVEDSIGPIARPEAVVFTHELPKTRSGKIMRRLLEDIANGEELGDLSALRNPEVVGEIESTLEDD